MKINDILTEAPKKKPKKKTKTAAKKKAAKNLYAPQPIADIDLQDAALNAANKIATFIKAKCQPWLKETNNGRMVVYRGISDRGGLAFTKKTREDRRPKDTDNTRHKAFNAAIAAAGGVANRENALFCSGDDGTASNYGKVYVLIPVGNFHYTWGTEWHDWTGDVEMNDLQDLLLPPPEVKKVDNEAVKQKLKAQIETYKKGLIAKGALAFEKERQKLQKTIAHYQKQIAKEKAKKNKSHWKIEDYQESIDYTKEELRDMKTAAQKKAWIDDFIHSDLQYGANSPVKKLRDLESSERQRTVRPEKDALDPKNYDPKEVSAAIYADKGLKHAIDSEKEIMIKCEAGLYVKPSFYKHFVTPILNNKKVTAKYQAGDDYDDDDDGYW